MDAILAARQWWETTAIPYKLGKNDAGKSVFASLYAVPEQKGKAIVYVEAPPNEAWAQIEYALSQAQNAHRNFALYVSASKNDPSGMRWPISINQYTQQGQPGGASINGIGNFQQFQQPNIGEIEHRLEKQFEEKLERAMKLKEMEDQIAGLSYELKAKKKKGDFFDKLEGFAETTGLDLSNPQSIQAVSGLVMGALDKILGAFRPSNAPVPGLAGSAAAQRPGKKIVEQPAPADVPAVTDEISGDGQGEEFELDDDQNAALDAVDILREAGCANPGESLLKVANFYAGNPTMAEGFLKQIA